MKATPDFDKLFNRLNDLLDRIEWMVPSRQKNETDDSYRAYRWTENRFEGIPDFDRVDMVELLHIERQKDLLSRNTAQFLGDNPANNALLWGARGTGKSSLIKSQLTHFKKKEVVHCRNTQIRHGPVVRDHQKPR